MPKATSAWADMLTYNGVSAAWSPTLEVVQVRLLCIMCSARLAAVQSDVVIQQIARLITWKLRSTGDCGLPRWTALLYLCSRSSTGVIRAAGVVRESGDEAAAVLGCWHAAVGDPASQQVLAHMLSNQLVCIACCSGVLTCVSPSQLQDSSCSVAKAMLWQVQGIPDMWLLSHGMEHAAVNSAIGMYQVARDLTSSRAWPCKHFRG